MSAVVLRGDAVHLPLPEEVRKDSVCRLCDGTGMVRAAICTCGVLPWSPSHDPYCDAEPCPAGCAFNPGTGNG